MDYEVEIEEIMKNMNINNLKKENELVNFIFNQSLLCFFYRILLNAMAVFRTF